MKKGTAGWSLVGVVALGLFACGTIGYFQTGFSLMDSLYGAVQLFVLEAPEIQENTLLNIARFFSPLLLAITAVLSFFRLLRSRYLEWRLNHLKNHVVICGLGRKGHELARRFMPYKKVVIIEKKENNDYAGTCRDSGAFLLFGDAADAAMLKKARVEFAREVYLFTGSDGTNFSSLVTLATMREKEKKSAKKTDVWLHLKTLEMCSFMRDEAIMKSVRKNVALHTINLFETAARDLVINHLVPLLPILPEDKGRIHLIQVGFGRMGQAIMKKLAQTAVTANYLIPKVTVVSLEALEEINTMKGEIPQIKSTCELHAVQGNILNGETRMEILQRVHSALDDGDVPVVCLAVDRQYTNVSAALSLAELFNSDGVSKSDNVPLFVRQIESEGWGELIDDLSKQKDGVYRHVKGFGTLHELCGEESLKQVQFNKMARAVHCAYVAANDPQNKPTDQPWELLSWGAKQANRLAVEHVRVKLRTLGLDCAKGSSANNDLFLKRAGENVEQLGRLEHCRWMIAKQLSNWTVGAETSYEDKIHKCLVEWDDLSDEEKQKDFDQILAIPNILAAGGLSIVMEDSVDE